jgi:hypothetical protein
MWQGRPPTRDANFSKLPADSAKPGRSQVNCIQVHPGNPIYVFASRISNPFRISTHRRSLCKSFRISTYEKGLGAESRWSRQTSHFSTLAAVSPAFAFLRKRPVPALRQEFGVAGGDGGPGEELFVGLAAAFNELRAQGVVCEEPHQGFCDLGMQRGGFEALGQKNNSSIGDGRSGLMVLQGDNWNTAGDAGDGASSAGRNGAAEE